MAGTQPETRLVNQIRIGLGARLPECVIIKNHGSPFATSGVPDLFVFHGGRAWALEVKHPSGDTLHQRELARNRATPLQRAMIWRLRQAGIRADVVTSVDEAWHAIQGGEFLLKDSPD